MSSSMNNLESITEEYSKTPCTANLSHILGREIVFEYQPRRIQKMILDISSIEGQLDELFQKAKNSDSVLTCGLSMDYLHLFKEYNSIIHEIEGAFEEMNGHSVSLEQLERWAQTIFKTTERMIVAVGALAAIKVDVNDPDRTRRAIDRVIKQIFVAYGPIDRVEKEITEASALDEGELQELAKMDGGCTPLLPSGDESDNDESDDDVAVYSDEYSPEDPIDKDELFFE
ncbi:hypothetical protein F4781DRAFT_405484 [Annulohypoxylon bovei var. microspora]|nr:hypothetical protein F4781DRAFT_405484 [Annulohypoxylon bovei var. microspora]